MTYKIDALFFRLGDRILHGLLIQQTILHQALREAAQRVSTGTSRYRNCVVIHMFKLNPG